MANLIVPLVCLAPYLQELIDAQLEGAKLRLFKNNVTVDKNTELGDLTEADFTGYAAKNLAGWSAPAPDGSDREYTSPAIVVFGPATGGASGNLYGVYATDSGGTQLLFAANLDGAPVSIPEDNVLNVNVTFTDISEF